MKKSKTCQAWDFILKNLCKNVPTFDVFQDDYFLGSCCDECAKEILKDKELYNMTAKPTKKNTRKKARNG